MAKQGNDQRTFIKVNAKIFTRVLQSIMRPPADNLISNNTMVINSLLLCNGKFNAEY